MKKVVSIIHKLLIIQLVMFCAVGCIPSDQSAKQLDSMLLYAMPDGGLRIFNVQNKETISLTEEKDYFPHLEPTSQMVFFIRLFLNEEKGETISYSAKIMQMNLNSKRIRTLSTIASYKTTPSLSDQLFFLNEGKILLIQNDQRIRMVDTKTGKPIPENLAPYLPELNQCSEDGKAWYIRIRQGKYPSFYKTEENLLPHQYFDSILRYQENGTMTPCLTIPKDRIYQDYIDGYAYSQSHSLLAIGYSGKIQIRDAGNQIVDEFPGKHPYFIKTSLPESSLNKFPLYKIQAFAEFQSYFIVGSLHWAGRIRKHTQDLQLFTDQELSLSSRDNIDPTNLFDHISVFRVVKNPPLLILTSVKDTEQEASASNVMALEAVPDQLIVLRLDQELWIPLLQLGEKIGLLMEWKDLDQDKTEELLIQYSASNFKCEGRFQSAGRTLIWTDVYRYHDDIQQYINDSSLYPAIYSALLKKLEPLYERALTAIRLKDPLLCQEDLDKLEQLIEEAKTYVSQGRSS
ncbi:hypothetical protein LLG10_00355 [bacterium]|nr:hypothetical protein [bacterium]